MERSTTFGVFFMGKHLRIFAFVCAALLCLMSGTAAHNLFDLEVDHASRVCLELGQHAICVSPLKH